MIGTNRDLKSIQRILDCQIIELKQRAGAAPEQNWISDRLALLGRQRIAVCATLVNRRIEAAKDVVDLSRWFNGNGALFGTRRVTTILHFRTPDKFRCFSIDRAAQIR